MQLYVIELLVTNGLDNNYPIEVVRIYSEMFISWSGDVSPGGQEKQILQLVFQGDH